MRLLAAASTLLGALVIFAAGQCNLVPAPDQFLNYPNAPITGEVPSVLFDAAAGCESGTWQLGRSHIFPRPDDRAFTVWSFHVVNPNNPVEAVLARFVMGTSDAYELKGAFKSYLAIILDLQFADGELYTSVTYGAEAARVAMDTWGWGTNSIWALQGGTALGTANKLSCSIGPANVKIAPPRYPCTSNLSIAATLQVLQHLGQTNQMPDASTKVDFTLTDANGAPRTLHFDNGIGFHEQIWSNMPFRNAAPIWRRGNARLHVVGDEAANHTVVWWEGTGHDGVVHSTAYASMDGKIVKEGCDRDRAEGLLQVETHGWGTIVIIKVAEGMNLWLDITKILPSVRRVAGEKPMRHERATGRVTATLGSEVKLTGVAWIEEGDFLDQPWLEDEDGGGREIGDAIVVEGFGA